MAPEALSWFYDSKEDLFTFNLKYLYFVGLWPKNNMSRKGRIVYEVYQRVLHIFSILFLVITAIGTYKERDNTTLLLANMDKCLVGYNFIGKVIFFVNKRKQLKSLIDDILETQHTVSENCKIKMVQHVVAVTVFMTAVSSAFTVMAMYHGEMTIDAWMPFDPSKSRMNLISATQILIVLFTPFAFRGIAMQGIICSIIMFFCDQLDYLHRDIKGLNYSKENDAIIRIEFREIIKKHVLLMRYAREMKEICEEYFLIQNLAITVELCFNAMMVTLSGSDQKTLLASFIAFLSCALLNAYVYCYLGDELIFKSQAIAKAAYESDWLSLPADLQKDLLTIITVAQRPLKMTAGAVAPMSLQTFGQALYNGYSIFAVLNDAVD